VQDALHAICDRQISVPANKGDALFFVEEATKNSSVCRRTFPSIGPTQRVSFYHPISSSSVSGNSNCGPASSRSLRSVIKLSEANADLICDARNFKSWRHYDIS
jgi:hypothetical protein